MMTKALLEDLKRQTWFGAGVYGYMDEWCDKHCISTHTIIVFQEPSGRCYELPIDQTPYMGNKSAGQDILIGWM